MVGTIVSKTPRVHVGVPSVHSHSVVVVFYNVSDASKKLVSRQKLSNSNVGVEFLTLKHDNHQRPVQNGLAVYMRLPNHFICGVVLIRDLPDPVNLYNST